MKRFLTKLTFSLFLIATGSSFLTAQKVVSGTVSDASNNETLIGASVMVKGTQMGTITDIDGTYSLKANAGDVLVFSYTGYQDQEIAVGTSGTVNISMVTSNVLDELVVVGYGSQKTKEITSAVVSVSKEEFNRGPITDAAQLLQGKVSGLQVYNRGGDPNRKTIIRLRGISTVGANVEPLVVVDGIIGASLANVDPNDIETMDVLKDGSAAAIYGSRGSSGVIIVTTKKGKKGSGVKLGYTGQYGVSSRMRGIKVMNAEEFVAAGGKNLGNSTDWISEVTQTGQNQIHGLSAEGSSGSTTYRLSANVRNVDGILKKTGFDQFNTRLNINSKALNDRLNIDFTASFTNKNQDFGFNEALRYAIIGNPTFAVNDPQSTAFGGYFEALGLFDFFNPVSIIQQNKNLGKRKEFNYGATFGYNIYKNLTANVRIAQQSNSSSNRQYYPTTSLFRGNASSPIRKGRADFYDENSEFKLYETYLSNTSNFGNSNLTLTAGYSYQQNNFENHSMTLRDFPDNSIDFGNNIGTSQDLQNSGFIVAGSSATPDEKIIAFFGRANYSFDDAIFLNASLRREGSTKLGEDNRWGLFPAVGVGVDINKYANISSLDLFKVRVGYGVTGSLPGPNGLSKPIRSIVNGPDGSVSTKLLRAGNPDLKWEEKGELNFGVDVSSGRFRASVDLYSRDIKDFILERTVDVTKFGVDRRFENAGLLNTQGAELSLNYDVVKNDDFNYTSGVILSTYKTVLKEYVIDAETRGNLGAPGQNGTNVILVKQGNEIGQIWGPVYAGLGDGGVPTFQDLNGDGQIITDQGKALDPTADFKVLGKGTPSLELGWTNTLNYKGWGLNAFFRGAFGHSLVNSFRAFYEPQVGSQSAYNFMNTSLKVDGLKSAKFSSLYVEKADFFKLDNLTISRSIPLSSTKYINNFNVSLTGQNLFVITNYTGSDPEPSLVDYGAVDNGGFENVTNPDVLAPGVDRRNNYYTARTITLGVNFNF